MHINADGKLVCPSRPHLITYNNPFPTYNGSAGGFSEPANGLVLHTEVGYEHSVIDEFNNPKAQASAFFSVGMDGHIHQYGPVGKGWKAWTQVNGNTKYRGVEHEDYGKPTTPFSVAQIESTASILEAVSRFDKFSLQVGKNTSTGKGVFLHSEGGTAWGGHQCPGTVRGNQRNDIISRAKEIRRSRKQEPVQIKGVINLLREAVHVDNDHVGKWDNTTDVRLSYVFNNRKNKDEQKAVGTKPDGVWGPKSQKAYHITVLRIQHALGVTEDGIWGKQTTAALQAARKKYYSQNLIQKLFQNRFHG